MWKFGSCTPMVKVCKSSDKYIFQCICRFVLTNPRQFGLILYFASYNKETTQTNFASLREITGRNRESVYFDGTDLKNLQ